MTSEPKPRTSPRSTGWLCPPASRAVARPPVDGPPSGPVVAPAGADAGPDAVTGVGADSPSVGSTVTARRTGRPSSAARAPVITSRMRCSRTSFVRSFGAARSAVPSRRPSGRVSRTNARCCGVTPEASSASSARSQTAGKSSEDVVTAARLPVASRTGPHGPHSCPHPVYEVRRARPQRWCGDGCPAVVPPASDPLPGCAAFVRRTEVSRRVARSRDQHHRTIACWPGFRDPVRDPTLCSLSTTPGSYPRVVTACGCSV